MTRSILLIHPDGGVRKDVRNLLTAEAFRLTEAPDLSLLDPGAPDVALIAWEALEPASESLRWMPDHNVQIIACAGSGKRPRRDPCV